MNERLQLILACIRVGRANVLTTRDIAKMTNLSVRKVRGGIAELRLNYSVPIVASRSLPRGYYFAENDDEYTAWVLQYKKQIKTEQKLLDSLKSTSWDHYKKKMNDADKAKKDRMKSTLEESMELTGHDRVDTTLFKVSFRRSKAVEVDMVLLPDEYKKVEYKADKMTLKRLLADGQEIAGATLVENKNLSIR